jgi:hypothetical protein
MAKTTAETKTTRIKKSRYLSFRNDEFEMHAETLSPLMNDWNKEDMKLHCQRRMRALKEAMPSGKWEIEVVDAYNKREYSRIEQRYVFTTEYKTVVKVR